MCWHLMGIAFVSAVLHAQGGRHEDKFKLRCSAAAEDGVRRSPWTMKESAASED